MDNWIYPLGRGQNPTDAFRQSGGNVTVAQRLPIGDSTGSSGTYRLSGTGNLTVSGSSGIQVGTGGYVRFKWFREGGATAPNGINMGPLGTLAMGGNFDANALANGTLFGGTLTGLNLASLEVTAGATAMQHGGTIDVNRLNIGSADGSGYWNMVGGVLNADYLRVGYGNEGALRIDGGEINVARELGSGKNSALTAMPGSRITLTGTDVKIQSTEPLRLKDLVELTLSFEPQGGAMLESTLEVAGRDLGATMEGFHDNFALGGLIVGSSERPGNVKLVDLFRNQGGSEAEALYVHAIHILRGSVLNLNQLRVYYEREFVNEGAVEGGSPILIPEPAKLGLLALAGCALSFVRKFRPASART